MKWLFGMAMLFLFFALPVNAELFSWTDQNGVKHYSNAPPPEGQAAETRTELKHDAEQYEKWNEARQSRQTRILEEGRSEAESRSTIKSTQPGAKATLRPGNVVMYSTPNCGYCRKAKSFFDKYKIAYTEYDITTDKQAKERFTALKGNGVPLIVVGDRRIPGFNEKLLRNLFGIN